MLPTQIVLGWVSATTRLFQNEGDHSLPTVDLGYQTHQAISFNHEYRTFNFTNIPYAEPPLGELRFLPPVPPQGRRSGIHNGSDGKICHQAHPRWMGIASQFTRSYVQGQLPFNYSQAEENLRHLPPLFVDGRVTEDCLVLDVLVPETAMSRNRPSGGAPVLVWIHGGAYVIGDKTMSGPPNELMAATKEYWPDGAIWVAMNYRLGSFGFLASPEDGIANAGLLDQRLALDWVQEHIHKFGGNPENVTIMGISAGAGSVMHQITAHGRRKDVPFHKAIAQSPGFLPVATPQQQQRTREEYLSRLGVSKLQDARGLSSERLATANSEQVFDAPYGSFVFGPVVDLDFVPAPPTTLLNKGHYATNVSVFSSFTANEGLMFTDPRGTTNDTRLRAQIQSILPQISAKNLDHVFTTLYPAEYKGSQPYTSALDRAQLIVGELGFLCNHNAMLEATHRYGRGDTTAFGQLFAVWPALHGSDQRYTFPQKVSRGSDDANNIAPFMMDSIARFVMTGSPSGATIGRVSVPVYNETASILKLVGNDGSTIIQDPTLSERCNWWRKALYY